MAQTTGAVPRANFQVEVSLNGSAWTDISGSANNVSVDGGDQMTGEQNTADGSAPVVVASGKTEAVNITVSCLYTETAGEAWAVVYAQYISTDKRIYFRYSPRGATVGNKRYVASNSANAAVLVPIVNCIPPEVDAGSGDPALFEFELLAPKLFQEAIT